MMSVPRSTSATASRCSRRMIPPVGLLGKGSTSSLVFGVIAARSASGVRRKPSSGFVAIGTGTPSVSAVIGV